MNLTAPQFYHYYSLCPGLVHKNDRGQDLVKIPPDSMRLVVTSVFRDPTNIPVSVLLHEPRNPRVWNY